MAQSSNTPVNSSTVDLHSPFGPDDMTQYERKSSSAWRCYPGKAGCCERRVSGFFYTLGHMLHRHPYAWMIGSIVLALALTSGVTRMEAQSDPRKLYVPQDSRASKDNDYVEATYGFPSRVGHVYMASRASGSNVLTKDALLDAFDAYDILLTTNVQERGRNVNWTEECEKPDGVNCYYYSVLDFWNNNRTLLSEDTDILATINNPNATDSYGFPLDVNIIMGGIERNASDSITVAKLFDFTILLTDDREEIALPGGDRSDDPYARALENAWYDRLRSASTSHLLFEAWFFAKQVDEVNRGLSDDVLLVYGGFVLMIIYASIVLARRHAVKSRGTLALAAVFSVGLAVGAAFGLCSYMGVTYSPAVQASIFVLLGLGIDDAFVIMGTHLQQDITLSISERMARTLSKAGASIAVTSITDFCAFVTGTRSQMPALRDFAIYAAVGVLFDFLFQMTFFVSYAIVDQRRMVQKRYDYFCCFKQQPSETSDNKLCSNQKYRDDEPGLMTKFIGGPYAKALLSPMGKVFALVASACLLGMGIYGVVNIKVDLDVEWFVPSDSTLHEAWDLRDEYLGDAVRKGAYYTKQTDYFAAQASMSTLVAKATSNPFIDPASVRAWYPSYIQWAQTNATLAASIDGNNRFNDSTAFYDGLQAFLVAPAGDFFQSSIVFASGSTTDILGTKIDFDFTSISSSSEQIDAMDRCRDEAEGFSGGATCFAGLMIIWEANKVILTETLQSVALAGVAVGIIVYVMLADLRAALIVMAMIAAVDVLLLGWFHYVDLTFNPITTILVIVSIGLAVDYSAHIAHAFMSCQGDRNRRAKHALYEIGGAVVNGGISTFVAMIVVSQSKTYVFNVFFLMFSGIVLFGLYFGVVCLPVVLSLLGPPAYPAEEVAAFLEPTFERMKSDQQDMRSVNLDQSQKELEMSSQ